MSAGATIEANARDTGHGGQVVLWADGSTRAQGQVSARGGAQGGDGGLIETSGQWLDVGGLRVDARAPLGQIGTWLLDPADITISSAVTTDATATGGVFAPNSGVSAANVNVADLVSALGGSNVTVSTANTGLSGTGSGDIHVDAAVTWSAATTLTLSAARHVNVNQAITGTGTNSSLVLNAGGDVTVGAAITTTTGQLAFTAAQDVNINAATTITTGNLQAVAGRNVTVSAASSITTGNMVLRADNELSAHKGQLSVDVNNLIGVNVHQFYGIEIEEFPAQIAQVALWLVDHQMNLRVSVEFGLYFARIPLKSSPGIRHANALRLD
jgi:large exoprotein involved in heme utilization and adhesion